MDMFPATNRTAAEIYKTQIKRENFQQLRNWGYDFLIVDWENSRRDMRHNAIHVINLIEKLKQEVGEGHQFVLMGESMGGVIGKMVLNYMESSYYANHDLTPLKRATLLTMPVDYWFQETKLIEPDWYNEHLQHNVRLFISIDSPHKGANVPMSIQETYETAVGALGGTFGTIFRGIASTYQLFLSSSAAKQLLMHHISTKSGFGLHKNFSEHPFRTYFLTELHLFGLDGQPLHCKTVAMSNGMLNAKDNKQWNYYHGHPRNAGDDFMNFETELYARILWIKVPIFGVNFEAKSNNDFDYYFRLNAGFYFINFKLYWFGVKIYTGYNSFINNYQYGDLPPSCVSAGGRIGNTTGFGSTQSQSGFNLSNNYWALNWFSYTYQTGGGCVSLDSHIGLNGLASRNFDFSACTDGMFFNFIPMYSALDLDQGGYSINDLLELNYEGMNITDKLSISPFDVSSGRSSLNFSYNANHLYINNHELLLGPDEDYGTVPYSCQGQSENILKFVLNREIGDEQLYLNNMSLNREGLFEAEYDIFVNVNNPSYEHVGQPFNPNSNMMAPGFYSHSEPFIIDGQGFAIFKYDGVNTPYGTGFIYNAPVSTNYSERNEEQVICCLDDFTQQQRPMGISKISLAKEYQKVFSVFPNPLERNQRIDIQISSSLVGEDFSFSLIDMAGKVIVEEYYKGAAQTEEQVTLSLETGGTPLKSGVYILIYTGTKRNKHVKLIVK